MMILYHRWRKFTSNHIVEPEGCEQDVINEKLTTEKDGKREEKRKKRRDLVFSLIVQRKYLILSANERE